MGSGPADDELVLRLRQRRPSAFEDVYARYGESIWRFLRRLCGRRDIAEDLFQETWLAAARNAHRLRADSQLLPWLYTIARNKHRNAVRFRLFDRKRREAVLAHPFDGPRGPDVETEERMRAAAVERTFQSLSAPHREVLLLVGVEGLSTHAAAGILGLREDAVRKRLSRARAELAKRIHPADNGEPSP